MICELWKGKESASLCSSYRDISIANTISKYYSTFLREHLMISYADYAKNTQCAGMAKRGTDTAMHLCRAHWPYSKFKGRNAGQLYMDLESAFASVAREIAFYGVASVESIAFIFLKLSIPPSVHRILLQSLGGQCPLREAGASKHLQFVLREQRVCTLFTTQGLEAPSSSTTGSRAGNPLGDIIFAVIMTFVHDSISESLRVAELEWGLPIADVVAGPSAMCTDAPMVPESDASYLDDAVLFVDACDPFALVNKVIVVAGVVIDVIQAHGMRANLKRGKTDVVLSFSGKGARDARMKVLCAGVLVVRTSSRGVVDLCVVRYYKHMGALSSPECNVAPEVRARVRLARAAFVEFRSGVFASSGLDVSTRMEFLHAFVDSRLFFTAPPPGVSYPAVRLHVSNLCACMFAVRFIGCIMLGFLLKIEPVTRKLFKRPN